VDVTNEQAVHVCVEAIEAQMGPIEIAIINAGDYAPMPLEAFDTRLFRRLIEVNYMGVVNCLAAVLPVLIPRAQGRSWSPPASRVTAGYRWQRHTVQARPQ